MQLNDIEDFHKKFSQSYNGPPRLIDGELAEFRIKFQAEELSEFAQALGYGFSWSLVKYSNVPQVSLHNAFDALLDQDYVLKGTTYLMGFTQIYEHGWNDVHAKNMSKILAPSPAHSTRNSSFDVIKPPGFTPCDHTALIESAKGG